MLTLKVKLTAETYKATMMCGVKDKQMVENCAFAYEIRKIFPHASVGLSCIKIRSRPGIYSFLTEDASKFIGIFDMCTPAERLLLPEQEFEFDVPDEALELINIDEVKELLINHPTLKMSL